MPLQVADADIEVDGRNIRNFLDAFKQVPRAVQQVLVKHGLGSMRGDSFVFETGAWYPLGPWVAANAELVELVGPQRLMEIGRTVPRNAVFPPTVRDLVATLQALDVAYHLNHRKAGQIMFDLSTGRMLEGIGHYGCEADPRARRIVAVCENPYPCEFDRGLLSGLAGRFEPRARVVHTDGPCRKKGADRCTFTIEW